MVKEITSQNFEAEVKNASKPVLLDFYAEWCGPCKQMAPEFEALAAELSGSHVFGKVNIDNERDLAIQHGISSIPTLVLYKDGTHSIVGVGYLGKDEIRAQLAA